MVQIGRLISPWIQYMHPCHFALKCCHIYHGDRCPYQKQQYVMQTAAPQYYRESCSSLLRHFDAQLLLDSVSRTSNAFQCFSVSSSSFCFCVLSKDACKSSLVPRSLGTRLCKSWLDLLSCGHYQPT